jgi:hypothetical protein
MSMNLNDIKAASKTQPREVEYIFAGKKTGWFLTLLFDSSTEVQEFMSKYNSKVRELSLKRKTNAIKNLAGEHAGKLHMVQVAGWRWKDGDDDKNGRPKFTKAELRKALNHEDLGWHLGQFIDEEVGSLDDFLTKSGGGSESA